MTSAASKSARANSDPMWGQVVPLLAALFLALSPLLIELSHEARPYALGTVLALAGGVCLLWAAQNPRLSPLWLGFALCSSLLTMTHHFGLFTVIAMVFWGLLELIIRGRQTGWTKDIRRFLVGWLLSSIAILLAWIPWLSTFLFQRERVHAQLSNASFQWEDFATVCWQVLAGGNNSDVFHEWIWSAPAAWGAISLLVFARCGAAGRLSALCAVIPLLAGLYYGLSIRNILEPSSLSFALVFLLIGCAQLLGRERFAVVRCLTIVAVVCWLGFWTWTLSLQRREMAEHPGTHGAVSYVNRNRDADSPVIVCSTSVYPIVLTYIEFPAGVWTSHDGDHRASLLSGASLREEDYVGLSPVIESRPEPIWVIDMRGLPQVEIPDVYKLVSEESFLERYGGDMELLVRRYELKRGLELTPDLQN